MKPISAKKIVVAYSGGLDTSVIIAWLRENSDAELVAWTADIGQGEELAPLDAKAKQTGASKLVIEDLREAFVKDFVFPALRANAVYEEHYLLGTSLARPIIGRGLIECARREGADAICHGATGKGNDQVRFELTAYAFEPMIKVIAPWRMWSMKGRSDLIDYAAKHGIPVPATKEKPYSTDRNLFHISYEGGVLEDPWAEPDASMFLLTVAPEKAPDQAEYVEINFEHGNPVAVNGKALDPVALLTELNRIGGKHGVGRVDLVENRYVGMKSRGVYETPGGTLLHLAHRAVEQVTLDREVMRLRDSLIPQYAELIYNGFWYAPERETLQALIDHSQKNVTGTARLKCYKGSAQVVGRKAPKTLYSTAHASFEAESVYNQADAEGFIRLNALRLRIRRQAGLGPEG
ncbi:MAG: argininosuccinate synthase [Deltaproteobacteria bacterium]|nr:argininosuccinate synthase [Deltaproteobacteria bacterium]